MNEHKIPEAVRMFIAEQIDSVVALEVLLLLYRSPQREWTEQEVASELRIDPHWTHSKLKALVRSGLACEAGPRLHSYRYYPESLEVNATVAALARTYSDCPLAVISYIYSKPSILLRRLADALRIRS
jgi:hypothetical protein